MAMTREEKACYARGYNTGRAGKWPNHKPPYPPKDIVAELMRVLREIRDELDADLAQIDDPDWEAKYGPIIERADAAAEIVSAWLLRAE